jgi:Tol biopolymer transport system component
MLWDMTNSLADAKGLRRACALLGTLFAIVLVAGLLAPSGEAAWPGREGAVVYRSLERTVGGEGWQPAGLSQIGLGVFGTGDQTSADASDRDPQVSPDGRLIVFSRGIEPDEKGLPTRSAIFIVQSDGDGLRQLTGPSPASNDIEPTFAASGRRILFVRLGDETARGSNQGDICSVDLNGQGLRRITSGHAADRSPAVSPSGRQLVFSRSGYRLRGGREASAQHIFSARLDGSHLRDLTPKLEAEAAASDPDFSPSGRVIAFSVGAFAGANIFTMRPNGSHLRRLTDRTHRVLHGYGYGEPAFSPAGGELFAVATNAYNTDLARIDLSDPDNPHRISSVPGDQPVWAPASSMR